MEIQDIINTYETLAHTDDVQAEVAQDAFSTLRKKCAGTTTVKQLSQTLAPIHHNYLQTRFTGFETYARKNNGTFKTRKIQFPMTAEAALDTAKLSYVVKDVTRKGVVSPMCIVCGLPDGYYTALKTIERAIEQDIPDWHKLSKSKIDACIRQKKALSTNDDKTKAAYHIKATLAIVNRVYALPVAQQQLYFDAVSDALRNLPGVPS